ncbi:anthranilate synthase component I [Desulfotomaculum sp. 1211_IL3151]|uniref:anthranilate synthase component I n=1 Tax=Desulfotomaculum sp. 1211_IL3151 TaxID=3084055 RepID=UPI002FD9327A
MIHPEKTEFLKGKAANLLVPVMLTFMADELTPISLFYSLEGERKFLLESAENGKRWGRYSLLGCNPYRTIYSSGDRVTIEEKGKTTVSQGQLLQIVEQLMPSVQDHGSGEMPPFMGGGIGYLGYDYSRQYEKIPDQNFDQLQTPEACLMFYQEVMIYDHYHHLVHLVYNVRPDQDITYEAVVERLKLRQSRLRTRNQLHPLAASEGPLRIRAGCTKEQFCDKVRKAKEHIQEGDAFQVVLSQRFTIETSADPFVAYRKLRGLNPSPYLFYIDFGTYQVVGASPESLVCVQDKLVKTNPIAGTRPRGQNPEADARMKEELLSDAKELAEHVMLVDLGRNDLGKVACFGSVKVERWLEVDFYSHVMHLVSTVTGQLRPDRTGFDALIACLPAGTVSGAPKISAMTIIDDLEEVRRGIYAGAVGYLAYTGNLDMCIAIRTIVFKDGQAYVQAGAGIVYDSVPEMEYQETLNKAMALKEVLA